MHMTSETEIEARRREAAHWFAKLNSTRIETRDVHAFSAWRHNPLNAQAYDDLEALWSATGALSGDKDVRAIRRETLGRVPRGPSRWTTRRKWGPPLVGLACIGLAATLLTLHFSGRAEHYSTVVGDRREVRLADGSDLTLDTASTVTAKLTGRERVIHLETGQAYFAVQRDATRPFRVVAGDVEVIAIGTAFEVRRLGPDVEVVLAEGRVRVVDRARRREWSLSPGQKLNTRSARPTPVQADVIAETSWREGRLIFHHKPLAAAIAEVNRYSTRHIILEASALSSSPLSGAFDVGDLDGFAAALGEIYPVVIETRGADLIVVTAPRAEKSSLP
ncbi:FecR family protein [Brevundimonas nasdae]|uniref:FecR domain-containing protein n=1 Tax=Brevundimonas nasdae TaxID=172043 RepID=A0ABX8TNJ6_9CAUL|nr:FecR domain-containing protein [Brevundimonas nasdae]QYC11445.1 FecR domain-containing protein [Brevundimonas nasdae]QYC14233.1 FecR domain-containing protein [Brevundimonas nasdae]